MLKVQERFEVDIKALPDQIDTSIYSKYRILWSLTGIHGTEVCCHLKCWCVVLCWLMYSVILRIQVKDSLLQRIILGWLLDNLVSPEDVPSVLIFSSLGPKTMKLLVLMFLGFYLHVTFSMLLANILIVRCILPMCMLPAWFPLVCHPAYFGIRRINPVSFHREHWRAVGGAS